MPICIKCENHTVNIRRFAVHAVKVDGTHTASMTAIKFNYSFIGVLDIPVCDDCLMERAQALYMADSILPKKKLSDKDLAKINSKPHWRDKAYHLIFAEAGLLEDYCMKHGCLCDLTYFKPEWREPGGVLWDSVSFCGHMLTRDEARASTTTKSTGRSVSLCSNAMSK